MNKWYSLREKKPELDQDVIITCEPELYYQARYRPVVPSHERAFIKYNYPFEITDCSCDSPVINYESKQWYWTILDKPNWNELIKYEAEK